MVEAERFRALVKDIPDSAYAGYPNLTRASVESAVEDMLTESSPG